MEDSPFCDLPWLVQRTTGVEWARSPWMLELGRPDVRMNALVIRSLDVPGFTAYLNNWAYHHVSFA